MTSTNTVIMSLTMNHPFRSVLEASINRLHEDPTTGPHNRLRAGDSWWFRVSIDNGSVLAGVDEAGSWSRTSMECHMSKQYGAYDEAAEALNEFLAEFYRDRS